MSNDPALIQRNAEIYARHHSGESLATLARAYGISRTRVHRIYHTAALHLSMGLPMTLPSGNGSWRVTKWLAAQRAAR